MGLPQKYAAAVLDDLEALPEPEKGIAAYGCGSAAVTLAGQPLRALSGGPAAQSSRRP